jgi:hypothetical protein
MISEQQRTEVKKRALNLPFAERYFSIPETAEVIRSSDSHVFKLLREKKLKSIKVGARTIISGAAILKMINGGA